MSPQVGGQQGLWCSRCGEERRGGRLSMRSETQALPGSIPRESADKVVLHTGKYEELIVCSHEIAASTAQLVAASKVRLRAQPCLASPRVTQLLAVVDMPHVEGRPWDGGRAQQAP